MIYLEQSTEQQTIRIALPSLDGLTTDAQGWTLTLSSTVCKVSHSIQPSSVERDGRYLCVSVTLPELASGEYFATIAADNVKVAGGLAVIGTYRRPIEEFNESSISIEQYER